MTPYSAAQHFDVPWPGNIQIYEVLDAKLFALCGPQTGGAEYPVAMIERSFYGGHHVKVISTAHTPNTVGGFIWASPGPPEFQRAFDTAVEATEALIKFYGQEL